MKKLSIFVASLFIMASCGNTDTTENTVVENQIENHEDHDDHHHNLDDEAIKLDNGSKWVVNEEMKPFLLKGEELVNNFLEKGEGDIFQLAEAIEEQNTLLIKSCTMKGESHDELHKWLEPHLALIKEMKTNESEEDLSKLAEMVKDSYEHYHDYFQ